MQTFAIPHGDPKAARLELIRGRKHLTVRAGQIDELCRGMFNGVTPRVAADDGSVTITYPRFSFGGLLRHAAYRAEIELSTALPWTLTFAGGVGDSAMDLQGLDLAAIDITGGASNLRLLLPTPGRDVRICVAGGASRLTLLRPASVPATLRISGGANKLSFDGERYGAIGGPTKLASNGGAGNHYEIDVLGGANDLTIAEVG